MNTTHRFATVLTLSTVIALLAACSAPQRRADVPPPADSAEHALVGDSLDPGDVLARSKLEGCELIPYDALRANCITQNNGLHGATACGAQACQQAAGPVVNGQRLQAWDSCVVRRTSINGGFQSTLNRIDTFKSKSPQYKGWDKKYKDALATLVQKIKDGQKGHDTALKNAKSALKHCQSMT